MWQKLLECLRRLLEEAEQILTRLEGNKLEKKSNRKTSSKNEDNDKTQLSFFQLDDPVLSEVRAQIENLDINSLTPVEALLKLNEIKKMVGG